MGSQKEEMAKGWRSLRKDGRGEWRRSKEKMGMAGGKTKAGFEMRDLMMMDEGSMVKGTEQGAGTILTERALASGVLLGQGLSPHPRLSLPQPLASGSGC